MRFGSFLKLCFFLCLFCLVSLTVLFASHPIAYAAKKPKSPTLSLNVSQGPLGATLTLKGKNFRTGLATISYIDANNTPGIFAAPSDNAVQVQRDGTFTSTNIILPDTGPTGTWKIVVLDSTQQSVSTSYRVLAVPGAASAGIPTVSLNPSNGKIGDVIAFSGENWLPQGTRVNLFVITDTATLPLLDTPAVSAKDGTIMGAFHVPNGLNAAQTMANLRAIDTNNVLHAQVQLSLLSPLPTATPTFAPTAAATAVSTYSRANTPAINLKTLLQMDTNSLMFIVLTVGVVLGVAGFMLILFMVPWGNRNRQKRKVSHPRSGHW
jgi:hypothetical protein